MSTGDNFLIDRGDLSKDIKYNKKNIGKYKSESNLNQFFN